MRNMSHHQKNHHLDISFKYTSIIYLNDDFSGGETYFAKLDKTIKPETGKIVLWKNIKENNEIDELMLHTGKSVLSKEKWILVIYIRKNHFNRMAACHDTDF